MDIPWNPAVLEQRIGRVHRLGQHKTVRVINFVTETSIEERILDLLKFKRSLFAGALDSDGENVVMVGESQFKRFMHSVETITENIEKVDPEIERQQQIEAEMDKKAADMQEMIEGKEDETAAERKSLNSLSDLFESGAQFLTNISKMISQQEQPAGSSLDTVIGRDEKTGRSYLKIPLPEMDVLNNIISSLGEFTKKFISKTT
jgi:hypothetical protein